MARLSIEEVLEFGLVQGHTSTDWEVYAPSDDSEFGDKLFESLGDTINLKTITATLKNLDGSFYDPINGALARCRINYGTFITDWFTLPPCGISFLPGKLPYKLKEDE